MGHHHHDHDSSELSDIELRLRALESILVEKGYIDPAAIDALVETYVSGCETSWAAATTRRALGKTQGSEGGSWCVLASFGFAFIRCRTAWSGERPPRTRWRLAL